MADPDPNAPATPPPTDTPVDASLLKGDALIQSGTDAPSPVSPIEAAFYALDARVKAIEARAASELEPRVAALEARIKAHFGL